MTLKLPTLYLAQHSYNQIKQHGSLLLKQYAHYSRKGIEKIKTIQHNSEICICYEDKGFKRCVSQFFNLKGSWMARG